MARGTRGAVEPPDEIGDELLREVGKKIFQARKTLGLTQSELGKRVGFQQPNVFEIEHGNVNVSLKALARIARALEVHLHDLLPEDAGAAPTRSQMAQLIASFDRLAEVISVRTSRDAEIVGAFENVTRLREDLAQFLGVSESTAKKRPKEPHKREGKGK